MMYRFRFRCSDGDSARDFIERRISADAPCGKGIFGRALYGEGIHFKTCGKYVDGFYLDISEAETIKGSPIRVCFKGRFVKRKNGTFFEGFIYPRMHEMLVLIFLIIYFAFMQSIGGLVMTAGVATILLFSYFDKFKGAASELGMIFR